MHCWARYLFYAVVAVLGVGQIIVACGQKGPLYLPDEPAGSSAAESSVPPPPPPSPDAEAQEALDDIPSVSPDPDID